MHKLDQGGLQLDQSQLPYLENLSLVQQETTQSSITKRPTTNTLGVPLNIQSCGYLIKKYTSIL